MIGLTRSAPVSGWRTICVPRLPVVAHDESIAQTFDASPLRAASDRFVLRVGQHLQKHVHDTVCVESADESIRSSSDVRNMCNVLGISSPVVRRVGRNPVVNPHLLRSIVHATGPSYRSVGFDREHGQAFGNREELSDGS